MQAIKKHIKDQGLISFANFMQIALYDTKSGYYTNPKMQIGNDFITAPELGNWLALVLGNIWKMLHTKINGSIIEFGPGSGKLCYDILTYCQQNNVEPENYYLIEISQALRNKQKQLIDTLPRHLAKKVIWTDTCPKTHGLIIANEYFDALPVEQFQVQEGKLYQRCVNLHENILAWHLKEIEQQSSLYKAIKQIGANFPENFYSEIQLNYPTWWQNLPLVSGALIAIDYGMLAKHYYSPGRNAGTLRCHYQHTAHNDPLINVGEQDITSQVNFSALAQSAQSTKWQVDGFCTQAQFLLQHGLDQIMLQQGSNFTRAQSYQLKQLLMPNEMGDAFKVMGATLNLELDWFTNHNNVLSLFELET